MAFPSAADFQFADDADFSFISYPQMRPIRSDYADFSTPLSPSCEEGSLSHSQALALSIRARDVAGGAIALPEFWSASGACARKGLAESAYTTELRLFDAIKLRVFVA